MTATHEDTVTTPTKPRMQTVGAILAGAIAIAGCTQSSEPVATPTITGTTGDNAAVTDTTGEETAETTTPEITPTGGSGTKQDPYEVEVREKHRVGEILVEIKLGAIDGAHDIEVRLNRPTTLEQRPHQEVEDNKFTKMRYHPSIPEESDILDDEDIDEINFYDRMDHEIVLADSAPDGGWPCVEDMWPQPDSEEVDDSGTLTSSDFSHFGATVELCYVADYEDVELFGIKDTEAPDSEFVYWAVDTESD